MPGLRVVTSYTHWERPGRALSTSEAPNPSGERFVESPQDTMRGVVGGTSIFLVGRLRHEMTCLSLAASEWPGWRGAAGAGHGWGLCCPLQPLTAAVSQQLHHACDGPGLSVVCFMRHDVLEYFSVYGTALSMWVSLMGEWPRPVAQCPYPTIHLPLPEIAEPSDCPHRTGSVSALSWASKPGLMDETGRTVFKRPDPHPCLRLNPHVNEALSGAPHAAGPGLEPVEGLPAPPAWETAVAHQGLPPGHFLRPLPAAVPTTISSGFSKAGIAQKCSFCNFLLT